MVELLNQLIQQEPANVIALISVLISISALIVTIIFNLETRNQYIKSLNPLLSCNFFQSDGLLLLSIQNTGKSSAENIRIEITKITNNGSENKLKPDDIFGEEFTLFPNEKTQGVITLSGASIESAIFPVITTNISYTRGNDNKKIKYCRTITFTKSLNDRIELSGIEEKLNQISYTISRLTNYIEGRFLFPIDTLNVVPHNSLYKDMKDAFNNIERIDNEHEGQEISNPKDVKYSKNKH